MKKILATLIIAPLVLTSCFYDKEEQKTKNTSITKTSSGKVETAPLVQKEIVSSGDKISVDYVGTLEDGTVFDSSLEESAKKTKNYKPNSGRKYEPLSFTVGAGQMIK